MKKILSFFFIFFSFSSFAQEPVVQWLKGYGGNSNVGPNVTTQSDGGFIIAIGSAINDISIDSLCAISGDKVVFMKYNADASVLEWTKCYHGRSADSGFACMYGTADGGYISAGTATGFTYKFVVHKEDASGAIVWSKSYGDSADAICYNMIATNDGCFVLFGQTNYTSVDFPLHYGSWTNGDFAVMKVDSNGNKLWSKVIGGTGNQIPATVIAGRNGGCYITGTTASDDYDCMGNHGGWDVYIARLDSSGNILWHKDAGGSNSEGGTGTYAYPDGHGGIIVATTTYSNDGDVTHLINPGGYNIWVLDVDSANHILWDNCYGGGGQEYCNAVCKATDGSIWVAGYSNVKSGEVDTAYGRTDAWFLHADSVGNFLSAKVLGSHLWDEGSMVHPLSNGNIIAGGYYDTAGGSFSPIITYDSYPNSNAFLTIFSPWLTSVSQVPVNIPTEIYPNPASKSVTINVPHQIGGSYSIVISDLMGRKVYKNTYPNGWQDVNIAVNEWDAGLYYVQICGEEGYCRVEKLIVQ